MNTFTFWNPVRVHFGEGQVAKLKEEIPPGKKVMLLYGGGSIKKNGVYEQVKEALQGYEVVEFSGIEPNPHYETLMQAVDLGRQEKVDFLLAVGGGSVIDGTKFVSVAIPFTESDPWTIISEGADIEGRSVPLGTVLTLPATGSEMNKASVVTKASSKEKRGFLLPEMFPQFSILDPTFTYSLPREQIANGVVDAFVHVTEQYLTDTAEAPLQERFAESLLTTLIEEGPKALALPEDYQVRSNIMWCTSMALCGLVGAGVPQDWATHMIGHELTAEFGLAHGTTLAIVLPSTLRVMAEQKRTKLLQYADRVWHITEGSQDERIQEAIDKTQSFFEAMGIKTRMGAYNVQAQDIDTMLGRLEDKGMVALGEQGNIDLSVSRKIFEGCL
jgi:NADP-dependent alcohol dehydrogenase